MNFIRRIRLRERLCTNVIGKMFVLSVLVLAVTRDISATVKNISETDGETKKNNSAEFFFNWMRYGHRVRSGLFLAGRLLVCGILRDIDS